MALVGNISGSTQNSSNIGISGSVVIANRPDALFPALGTLGTDVVFFVSGTRGGKGSASERTVSVFGGDAVISGSLTIGTGSVTVTSNDIQFVAFDTRIQSGSGGLTFFDAGNTGGITLTSLAASSGDVVGPASSTDNAIAVYDGTTGKLLRDTSVIIDVTNNVAIPGSLTVTGDLTVNGTTTTVNTTNLVVKDPLIYMGSASAAGTVAYGGIALASGSGVTDQALVFVKDGTGTNTFWSSGRQDVVSGTRTDSTGLIYLPVRASKFELGGTVGGANNAFLTSSDGASVVLSGSGVVTIGSNALQAVDIQFGGSQFATIAPVGTSVKLGASAGNNLALSGSRVIAQTSPGTTGGVLIQTHATDFITIISGTAPNTIAIRGEQSGNTLDLFNTNSTTINFGGAASSITVGATGGSSTVRNKLIRNGNLTSPSWTTSGISGDFAAGTYTDSTTPAAGTVATRSAVSVNRPTYASTNAITVTDAANLYVNNSPAAGTNTTITNPWALWVDDGESRFDGNVVPGTDLGANLGSPSRRWGNIYTGDLHLRNDRGDYTLIEEEDFLSIRFNKTGKRYKFVLEPVPELDEK